MELTPEERRRIYEEEKERIENEKKQQKSAETPTLKLPTNVASTLCYALFWISGIIFVVLEKQDKTVQHALSLRALQPDHKSLFEWIPHGQYFQRPHRFIGFCFWIVLMVKACRGERYVPLAGKLPAIHHSAGKPMLLMKPKQDAAGISAEKKRGGRRHC